MVLMGENTRRVELHCSGHQLIDVLAILLLPGASLTLMISTVQKNIHAMKQGVINLF
jgi:hypothetical protein